MAAFRFNYLLDGPSGTSGNDSYYTIRKNRFLEEVKNKEVNIHELDEYNYSLFNNALETNNFDVCICLIKNGLDVNQMARVQNPAFVDEEHAAPLYISARYGEIEIVRLLLKYGAEIDKTNKRVGIHEYGLDDEGQTALHIAAKWGYLNICKLLLKHGANCMLKNEDGFLPIDLAGKNGKPKVYDFLKSYMNKLNNSQEDMEKMKNIILFTNILQPRVKETELVFKILEFKTQLENIDELNKLLKIEGEEDKLEDE